MRREYDIGDQYGGKPALRRWLAHQRNAVISFINAGAPIARETVTTKRCSQDGHATIKRQLPVHPYIQLLSIALELPGVVAAMRLKTQIDAVVLGEVTW